MDKVWFITGISSGFGEALAQMLLERGYKVAGTFRKREQADAFIARHQPNGLGLVVDVQDGAAIKQGVAYAVAHFGRIDVCVNNAGYGLVGAIEEVSGEEARHLMETNFFGALAVTQEVLPLFRQQGSGYIVQISSVAGFRASAGFGLYNASKFALEGFSEALAQEVAPFGIGVLIVEPGPFRTKFAGSSVTLAAKRMEEYSRTPAGGMYQYIQKADGTQEGDPAKGAAAIIDYVESGKKGLRLPLGKLSVQAIKAKIAAVGKEVDAVEEIAVNTGF